MSVRAKKLPTERTLLAAMDGEASRSVRAAKEAIAPVVAGQTPRKSGKTAAALRPRVGRTPTGASLSVGAPRGKMHDGKVRIAQVVRWVNRGTGLLRTSGGSKRRIRSSRMPPRRLILPGGRRVWSVRGQKANPFMGRIQAIATPRVERAFQQGAATAARAIERQLG